MVCEEIASEERDLVYVSSGLDPISGLLSVIKKNGILGS